MSSRKKEVDGLSPSSSSRFIGAFDFKTGSSRPFLCIRHFLLMCSAISKGKAIESVQQKRSRGKGRFFHFPCFFSIIVARSRSPRIPKKRKSHGLWHPRSPSNDLSLHAGSQGRSTPCLCTLAQGRKRAFRRGTDGGFV